MPVDTPPPVAEIVVTAARLPPGAGEAAFSVTQVMAQDLRAAGRVDAALTATPGVSLFRRASSAVANPTTQGLSLRAIAPSGAGRALVLLDGVPLNDPFGGWVIWSQLPPEALEGAAILRGAGAGPYGAGALTGVVRLDERSSGGLAEVSAGGRRNARAAAAGVAPLGGLRLFGSASYETDGGYRPVRGSAAGAADDRLDLEARSATLRVDAPIGEAMLSLRAATYREDRGAGLVGAGSRASGDTLSATFARAPAAGWGWRLQAWRRTSDLANRSVSVAAGRVATTPANDQFATPAEGWGVNAALRRTAGRFEGEAGLDARGFEGEVRERFRFMGGDFTRERRAGGRQGVAGAYAEGTWTGDRWLATGGVRVDGWSSADGVRREVDRQTGGVILDDHPADRSGRVVSARLGLRRTLGERLSWRAATYSGFRPPSLNELHRPFRVGNDITEANAALEPERLVGVETGFAWRGRGATAQATVFWNRLDDAIANVTIGAGPGTFPRAGFVPAGGVLRERRNAGRIEAWGMEAELRRQMSGRLAVEAAVAFTDATVDGGGQAPQLTGLRPAQAPRWAARAGLDWRAGERLSLAADLRYEGRRFDDDLNSRVLSPALTLDLRADWRLRGDLGLFASLENALDERVETAQTADGVESFTDPRFLRVGLTWRLRP
ncbi:MAG: TonB-dependent receptor [Caulobacteraceae bacterium]|nr:TonB-dependent receptor [Caulobacteraceae bacterium]